VREEQDIGRLDPRGQAGAGAAREQERQRAEQHRDRHARDQQEQRERARTARAAEPLPRVAVDQREARGHARVRVVVDAAGARGDDRRARGEREAQRDDRERRVEREHEPAPSGSAHAVDTRSTTRTRAGTSAAPDCSSETVHASVTTLPSVMPDCITTIAAASSAIVDAKAVGRHRDDRREQCEAGGAQSLRAGERDAAAGRVRELAAIQRHRQANRRLDEHHESREVEATRCRPDDPRQQHRRQHRHRGDREAKRVELLEGGRERRRRRSAAAVAEIAERHAGPRGNGSSRLWATARSEAQRTAWPRRAAPIPLPGRRPAHDAGFDKPPATHCSRQHPRNGRVPYVVCATA
jgi:hypothetical protein